MPQGIGTLIDSMTNYGNNMMKPLLDATDPAGVIWSLNLGAGD